MSGEENSNAGVMPVNASDLQALLSEMEMLRGKVAELEGREVIEPDIFKGTPPRYLLNEPCFLEDDTLHDEGEEIEYIGTPNLSMVPQNEPAHKRMKEFIGYLTERARAAAELHGRPFLGLVTDRGEMIAQSLQDARRAPDKVIVMPVNKGEVPAMPHTPEAQAQQRRRGRGPGRKVISARPPKQPERQTTTPAAILGSEFTQRVGSGTTG